MPNGDDGGTRRAVPVPRSMSIAGSSSMQYRSSSPRPAEPAVAAQGSTVGSCVTLRPSPGAAASHSNESHENTDHENTKLESPKPENAKKRVGRSLFVVSL